jgi:hypothetical protein
MSETSLTISSEPIGKGRERSCYLHPDYPALAVKISGPEVGTQSKREIRFYRQLEKRKSFAFTHIPEFHGVVNTNLGRGIVVDLIRDYNGRVSRSVLWYLDHGVSISTFEPLLADLKDYLLQNLVIINHDFVVGNLLLQNISGQEMRLVAIDGLGDVVAIQWLNAIPALARSKINRRWDRFIRHLYTYPEVLQYLDPKQAHPPP